MALAMPRRMVCWCWRGWCAGAGAGAGADGVLVLVLVLARMVCWCWRFRCPQRATQQLESCAHVEVGLPVEALHLSVKAENGMRTWSGGEATNIWCDATNMT